jgi:hypothetical protein
MNVMVRVSERQEEKLRVPDPVEAQAHRLQAACGRSITLDGLFGVWRLEVWTREQQAPDLCNFENWAFFLAGFFALSCQTKTLTNYSKWETMFKLWL